MRHAGRDATGADPHCGLFLDFVGGALGHRVRSGGGAQALRRAVGFTNGNTPSIVDATAGLGRDAFLLAAMGARVTLVERSPEVHALLQDAQHRACAAGEKYAGIVGRMTLLLGDAKDILPGLEAEVVLVDPMHPPRKGAALVKNEMRLLRGLVGPDSDALELMQVALACATRRVVLKWPLRADPISGLRKASHQILGKTTRYDVFMTG
ncbi:MAG: class I SAM-dependent methyltransferase [Phaeospirillum sp.]|nr:class I SAM-dependent methyltransferase [Phaeospirillum sp.]